tara:strand:+ start:1606 stop:1794 length:189 start_codon:yes stop_codon:yes gene_type:complete
MRIGDLVRCWRWGIPEMSEMSLGVIVGFNEKGEGGKDFVHVFVGDEVIIFMHFDVEVINESG